MWLIKVKSPYFSESRAGVQFVNGKAETDDPKKARALAELGYDVAEVKPEKATEKKKPKGKQPAKKTAKK